MLEIDTKSQKHQKQLSKSPETHLRRNFQRNCLKSKTNFNSNSITFYKTNTTLQFRYFCITGFQYQQIGTIFYLYFTSFPFSLIFQYRTSLVPITFTISHHNYSHKINQTITITKTN
ncbi:hypothetical protein HanRHA438_Chr11g0520691 [Helianthus annuus]|nr:hypothetical protein HanRHA438_Chr11g0520691 [Helianthus annuus]